MQEIVKELTEIRKAQGLRQIDIAEAVGVTQPVISEFESGKTEPRIATVIKYAHVLGYGLVLIPLSLEEVKKDATSED